MQNYFYNSNFSQSQKRLPRRVIGDITFALYQQERRQKTFLSRNLTRILQHHEQRCDENGASSNPEVKSSENSSKSHRSGERRTTRVSAPNGTRVDAGLPSGADSSLTPVARSTSQDQPASHKMAPKSLATAQDAEVKERTTRRSIRGVLDRVYEDDDSELTLNLTSIRKKLNFKVNSLDENERPAKRRKRDAVRCHCHLTIWDNRDGFAGTPLTSKSSYCHVTATETAANGPFVVLELDTPFTIRAAELKVPIDTKHGSVLGVIDKYFLEIKIIPCRSDVSWPPIPILGKSDGDHFARDVRKTGAEELQGAVVARYMHLPQAPESDVPLSVFFLHDGRTYRTKHGLQVTSTWQKSSGVSRAMKQEKPGLDLDSFKTEKNLNGVHLAESADEKEVEGSPPPEPPQNQPEVCYSFCATISTQVAQEFRVATVKGYRCPLCSVWRSHKLQNLQFHLQTSHSKFVFSVQKPRRDRLTNELTQVQIKVDLAGAQPTKKEPEIKAFEWFAPTNPFDLPAYVDGSDPSWLTVSAARSNSLNNEPSPLVPSPYASNRGTTRKFPLASDVPDFRKPTRKRYRAIQLVSKYPQDEPEFVHTSVSHRAVSPSEDARSETDDEIDNEWQIELHMERLDRAAQREGWTPYERELRKRWDRHRMEERLEHSRYLSNCLVRFLRKQREWLRKGGDDLLTVFFEFLEKLKTAGVIDDDVVADVNELVFQDPPSSAAAAKERDGPRSEGPVMPLRNGLRSSNAHLEIAANLERRAARAAAMRNGSGPPTPRTATPRPDQTTDRTTAASQTVPSLSCGLCQKTVKRVTKDATWCMDPECTSPGTKYHKKCALAVTAAGRGVPVQRGSEKMIVRPATATSSTTNTTTGAVLGHAAEKEIARQKDELALQTWCCRACVARQQARLKVKEAEKMREREMVAKAAATVLGSMA